MDTTKIQDICKTALERIRDVHIGCFRDMDTPLFCISNQYPGLWMEHAYDSVLLAKLLPEYVPLAENAMNLFLDRQTEEGQLPFSVWDGNRMRDGVTKCLYSQVQECVSFLTLCREVYDMNRDRAFLEKAYTAGCKWMGWFRKHRMTTGRGLIEMFCGYDTGHDNSGRLSGISCPGNYNEQNAAVLPPEDGITPILAVDMNANHYGDLAALADMATLLGRDAEAEQWRSDAREIKANMFRYLWNEGDGFFYDVDKNNVQRKYKSSTIFHLFLERVLDPVEDEAMIQRIYREHIKNPDEFWTPYPFPSMAVNDPSCEGHKTFNCWGYYTQGLIVLRCTRWMDAYGWGKDFDYICEKWLQTWTEHYDTVKLAQEIDPITGEPTKSSQWYSSCMLMYLYAAKRLGIWEM